MPTRSCVSLLAILLACSASLHAQVAAGSESATPTIIKASAHTVVVDVVVTGKNGQPVQGLHKEDFLAAEDGHPQEVRFFEEHTGARATPKNLPALPPNIFTNIPRVTPTDSVTVLLLDALNTPLESQSFVRTQMLKYIRNLQPGHRLAIFTLGNKLRYIQGFTDDPSLLAAVLKNPKNATTPQASSVLQSHGEIVADQQAIAMMTEHAAAGAAALKQFQAEQSASQNDLRVAMTLNAFQQLAGYLAGIPGRKNVVWFSSAFPIVLFPNADLGDAFATQRDHGEEIRKTDALLAAAQVAIYPLAAEGLATDAINNADQQAGAVVTGQMNSEAPPGQAGLTMPRGQAAQIEQSTSLHTDATQRNANHTAMDEIARDTGGEAIYNTNGLNDALARIEASGSHYYTLAYTPTNSAADGQFRKIEMKLVKGGDKLTYRRGYYASDTSAPAASTTAVSASPQPVSQPADPMLRYMLPGLPDSTQIPLGLRVQPSVPQPDAKAAAAGDNAQVKPPLTRYSIDFVLAARDLKLLPTPANGRQDKIEATLVIYGGDGKALNWLVRQLDLSMDAARYKTVLASGINFRLDIDAPKDAVTLRSGVFDMNSNRVGTLEIPLSQVVDTAQAGNKTP